MTANPMLQALAKSPSANNLMQIRNMMNLIKNSNNPQALLTSMISQNPQMQQVMSYVNQNGGDAKQAFYKLAQEKGVNPDDILNALK